MNQFDGDELDSFYELIGAIFLMLFCAFAIGFMATRMSSYINRYHHHDKIEVSANAAEIDNPFNYTGYEAYMFAWVMDPYSDVSITWLSSQNAMTDDNTNRHVTISTLDEHGNVLSNFIPYRNQLITGGQVAADRNVKNVIRQVFPSNTHALYAGDTTKCNKYFHLVYTGDYTNNEVPDFAYDGTTVFERRKLYSWILVPVTSP